MDPPFFLETWDAPQPKQVTLFETDNYSVFFPSVFTSLIRKRVGWLVGWCGPLRAVVAHASRVYPRKTPGPQLSSREVNGF